MIMFAQEEVGRESGRRLAHVQDAQRKQLLNAKHDSFAGAVTEGEADKLVQQLRGVLAAVTRGRPPSRPSSGRSTPRKTSPAPARFKGCHHCGSLEHRRDGCKEYLALLDKNGKPPGDYEGKFERWTRNQKKKAAKRAAAAITSGDPSPS